MARPPIPTKQEVLFIENRTTNNVPPKVFLKGSVYELPQASVEYWLARGAITIDADEIAAAKKPPAAPAAPKPAPPPAPAPADSAKAEIPSNWKFLKGEEKLQLALKLGAPADLKQDQAHGFIQAKTEERAADKASGISDSAKA
jgi:hypothetical protein